MRKQALLIFVTAIAVLPLTSAFACSASNENGDVCSISCETGQTEMCINAAGAGAPQCMCTGTPSETIFVARLLGNIPQKGLNAPHLAAEEKPAGATNTKLLTITDASTAFADLLTKYGAVQVTRYHTERRDGPKRCEPTNNEYLPERCYPTTIEVQVPVTTLEILQATDLTVVSSTQLTFGEPKFQNFPDQLVAHYKAIINCIQPTQPLTSPPTSSINLQISVGRNSSIAFSHSFTHGGSVQVNGGVNVEAVHFGAAVTVSNSETTGTAETNSNAYTISQSGTATYQEPFRMKSLVGITAYQVGEYIPFKFTATLDADLSANDKHLTKASQIIDEKERTFLVEGVLISNSVSDGTIVYYDPQPVDPQECKQPGISIQDVGTNLTRWMLNSKPMP